LEDIFFGKRGISVKVFNNNMIGALTQLKRKVNAEGLNRELRKREAFESNTSKRRRKMAEAKIRWKKKQDLILEVPKPKRKLKRRQLRQQQQQQTTNPPAAKPTLDNFA
jgi:ribosomal protein S21